MKRKLPGLIGVIHLPPLAGAPGARSLHPAAALARAGAWAVKEATALERAGFEGLILENFGDVPFYKDAVPPETLASLAVIAAAVRESVRLPIGINVLRNDAKSALAIAAVTGCDFIRVNVLAGVYATDQGLIEGHAAELARERERLGVEVAIFADAQVKHARALSQADLELEIEELALRSGADAVIVTGTTTGRFPDAGELEKAARTGRRHGIPLYIGSGATTERLADLRKNGFGVIVGSALRRAGKAGAPLDPKRITPFVKTYKKAKK